MRKDETQILNKLVGEVRELKDTITILIANLVQPVEEDNSGDNEVELPKIIQEGLALQKSLDFTPRNLYIA